MEAEGLVTIDGQPIRLTDDGMRAGRAASCAATASPSASSPTSSACRGPTPTHEAGKWEHVISDAGRGTR